MYTKSQISISSVLFIFYFKCFSVFKYLIITKFFDKEINPFFFFFFLSPSSESSYKYQFCCFCCFVNIILTATLLLLIYIFKYFLYFNCHTHNRNYNTTSCIQRFFSQYIFKLKVRLLHLRFFIGYTSSRRLIYFKKLIMVVAVALSRILFDFQQ